MSLSFWKNPAFHRRCLTPLLAFSVLSLLGASTGTSGVLWSYAPMDSSKTIFPTSLSLSPGGQLLAEGRWLEGPLPSAQDSPAVGHPGLRLLPASLSPMESLLWGQSGILRTTGIAPLTPSARTSELHFRRTMLTIHQIGGFVTLGLLVPTLVLGQRNIQNWNDAMMGVKPLDRQLDHTHRMWAELAFTSYLATAAMAILSPPPIIRRNEASTITTHKILAWIHFTGMIATPILAILAAHASTVEQARTLRTAHQITAYTTAAALATAMIVITF